MKKILLFLTAIFTAGLVQAQLNPVTGDYRTKTSGTEKYTWGQIPWWEVYDGSTWVDATALPGTSTTTITLLPRTDGGGGDVLFETNTAVVEQALPTTNLVLLDGFTLVMGNVANTLGRTYVFNNIALQGTSKLIGSTHKNDAGTNYVTINGVLTVASGATFNLSGSGSSTGNTVFTTQAGFDNRPTGSNVNYGTVTLPLSLLSFDVKKELTSVELSWRTTSEVNTNRVEVERASNNADFVKIGDVASKNTSGNHFYSFKDNNPVTGNNYYRLKMIDNDGTSTYSTIKVVSSGVLLNIYPNPVTTQLKISLSNTAKLVTAKVYDTTGKVLSSTNFANTAQFSINTESLSAGTYVLKLDVDGVVSPRKFVK